MAILRNGWKLASMNRENNEDHPRDVRERNTNSRIQEDYITQVSEEIVGRVTKIFFKTSIGLKVTFWVPCNW